MTLDQARNIVRRLAPNGGMPRGGPTPTPTGPFGDPGYDPANPFPNGTPTAGGDDILSAPGGGGGNAGKAGFDENGRPLPGYDLYGHKIPEGSLPPGWVANPNTGELLPPESGGATGGAGIPMGELFQEGDTVYRWNGTSITKATVAETRAFLNGDYSGGSSDPYAANQEARAQGNYQSDLDQRAISNAMAWQDLLNSQKYQDRNFAQGQVQDNRTEMGNRAGTGLSLGNLLLSISERDDALANDPGNFPAWVTAMQNNTALGPVVQNLVGEGVSINPQNTGRGIDDPRYGSVLDSLLDYSKVPTAGDVDRTQNAYNTDPEAARRWFEAAQAIEDGKGKATGGQLTVNNPTRFQDLLTGQTVGVAGEQGPETVNVDPIEEAAGVRRNDPRIGSAGTFGALSKAIKAGSMYSAFPRDVLDQMAGGMAPTPSAIPDWLLEKLPPSLQGLLAAGLKAQLGAEAAADWDWTRGLYEPKGFSSLSSSIAR